MAARGTCISRGNTALTTLPNVSRAVTVQGPQTLGHPTTPRVDIVLAPLALHGGAMVLPFDGKARPNLPTFDDGLPL